MLFFGRCFRGGGVCGIGGLIGSHGDGLVRMLVFFSWLTTSADAELMFYVRSKANLVVSGAQLFDVGM